MKAIFRIFTLTLCVILLTGCHTMREQRTLVTAENYNTICDMAWTLQTMTLDGVDYDLKETGSFLQFSQDGKVSGKAPVNRLFGSMAIDNQGQVTWPKVFGTTRMAGPEEAMKLESSFLAALPKTAHITRDGLVLYISSLDNQTKLVFIVLP